MKLLDNILLANTPAFKEKMFEAAGKRAQEIIADAPRKKMINGYVDGETNYIDSYGDTQDFKYQNNEEYNKAVAEYVAMARTLTELTEPGDKKPLIVDKVCLNAARVISDLVNKGKMGELTFPTDHEDVKDFIDALDDDVLLIIANRLITGKSYSPTKIEEDTINV